MHNAGFHIREFFQFKMTLVFCFFHRKGIMSTLKMIVGKNRTAYDRQIGIGTKKIMRKKLHKIKESAESSLVNFHWHMAGMKHDAVFIIIHIRRILQSEFISGKGKRYDSVVLSRRMIDASCVTLILHTQQTLRISALFRFSCCRYRLRIFLRL